MKYKYLSKKRISKNKNIKKRKTRKLHNKKITINRKNKYVGGEPASPISIDSGNENFKIEYFTDISDLSKYLDERGKEDKPTYVYLSIGSKTPQIIQRDDTTNSKYQAIPGFFDEYEGNVFILMLDIFYIETNPEYPRKNEFEEQAAVLKRRFQEIYSYNKNISIHLIMCNFRFEFDSVNLISREDREQRQRFIASYTNCSVLLYSLLNYTYNIMKREFANNKIFISNFIGFKRPNAYETSVLSNSNKLINWALGGNSTINNIDTSSMRRFEEGGLLTDSHYIWAGYTFWNIIYKYIDHNKFENILKIYHTYQKSVDISQLKNITFNDIENCELLKYSKPRSILNNLFYPYTVTVKDANGNPSQQTINMKLIDFTSSIPILLEDYPNICEGIE
jgi:hypothetical protein